MKDRKVIISLRIPEALLDEINEDADYLEISQADWLRDAIETYLSMDDEDDDEDEDEDEDDE